MKDVYTWKLWNICCEKLKSVWKIKVHKPGLSLKTLNVIKMSILPKVIYKFNTIPVCLLVEITKLTQKFIWKCKRTRGAKIALSKKNKIVVISTWFQDKLFFIKIKKAHTSKDFHWLGENMQSIHLIKNLYPE